MLPDEPRLARKEWKSTNSTNMYIIRSTRSTHSTEGSIDSRMNPPRLSLKLLVLTIYTLICSSTLMAHPYTLRLITCNVRYDGLSSHPIPIPPNGTIQTPRRHWTLENPYGERPWAERRSRLVDALMFWGPDVIGFQVSLLPLALSASR